MICSNLIQSIGHTPLIEARNLAQAEGVNARILLKAEMFNPGGSVKDRAALAMIEDAEFRGTLRKGSTIVEPTSGNTGIGLAWIGVSKGYRVILTMPETMSVERRQLLAAYGAEIVLTPASEGMKGAISRAEQLCREIEGAVILGQFDNPANAKAHELTTGPEIFEDTEGKVDIFVAGVGSGGTITGVGRALKSRIPGVKIVAVEPQDSPVLSGGKPGAHLLQGIGAGFVSGNFDRSVVDEILTVSAEDAFRCVRQLSATQGLLAGISSGAALSAAISLGRQPQNKGKTIVTILPDTGTRYLSIPNLFQ